MPRSSKKPNLNTMEAKTLYLVGDGTGPPISDPKEIAKRTGCHERTIRDYIKTAWRQEREEMLLSVQDGSLVVGLSEETLAKSLSDEKFLRDRLDSLKIELSEIEETSDKLFDLLDRVDELVNLQPKEYEKLVRLLELYLESNSTKKVITNQFLAVKKAWDAAAGIEARMKAGEVALKTISQTHARHETQAAIERAKQASIKNATPGQTENSRLSMFKRES